MGLGNIELVRIAYDVAYAQRSVAGVRDRFADDFVWHSRPEFPGRAAYTADEMPDLWADLDETFSEFTLTPTRFEERGDFVLVAVEISSRLRDSEARIKDTVWHLWRFREGKACEAWAFSDRRQALDSAGLTE